MSKYYDEALIPAELRRTFDVYDRIRALQLPLGSFETDVVSLANAGIAGVVLHESGLVYLSGTTGGTLPMADAFVQGSFLSFWRCGWGLDAVSRWHRL
jgi:hypothetical protein